MSLRQQAETIAVNAMGVMHKATLTNIEKITLDLAATAIEQLVGAQLAESVAREVKLLSAARVVSEMAPYHTSQLGDSHCPWCSVCFHGHAEPPTVQHKESCPIAIFRKASADALAAPPSTAAAELVNLRELETLARDYFSNAATIDVGMAIIRKLAAVAAARAGTLVPAGGERGG